VWAICGATEGVAPDFIEARLLRLALPYSKTRPYLFLVGPGCLATVISGVLDHARPGFHQSLVVDPAEPRWERRPEGAPTQAS
jgi:hypothetical protein